MRIAIPSADGKLCAHFGHCENFTFVDVEDENIVNIEVAVPEDGISCQSAGWVAQKGADVVLAGGMGGRPLEIFANSGVQVVAGCPELDIKTLVAKFVHNTLAIGDNSCGGGHHHCGGHCHH